MDTQHSTLNVFELGNPECGVWILSVECWISIISLGPDPKLMTITQHSTLKTSDSAPCIWMGNLKWGRIHTPHSGFPHSYTLSVECWVSIINLGPGLHISRGWDEVKCTTYYFMLYKGTVLNKSAKWHCGRHTLICKKILVKKTWLTMIYEWFLSVVSEKKI